MRRFGVFARILRTVSPTGRNAMHFLTDFPIHTSQQERCSEPASRIENKDAYWYSFHNNSYVFNILLRFAFKRAHCILVEKNSSVSCEEKAAFYDKHTVTKTTAMDEPTTAMNLEAPLGTGFGVSSMVALSVPVSFPTLPLALAPESPASMALL